MARLRLALLGEFHATGGARTGLCITSKKARALLAYLALRPGQRHARDYLAGLLWGEVGSEQARHSLRQTLLALRHTLPRSRSPILLTEGDAIAVHAIVDVDAVRFERLAACAEPAALEQALALYRDDLLTGLRIREPSFEEWLRGERERLRGLAAEALERLSTHQLERDAVRIGIRTGLRLLARDPLHEPIHRALMRLYAQSGRKTAALDQYRTCEGSLKRELGVRPDAATRKLFEQILSRSTIPMPAIAHRAPGPVSVRAEQAVPQLVGRTIELELLTRALGEARDRRGSLVTVSGEAGIGKSRLIQELSTRAERLGCHVVVGRCFESEQVLPFAPWASVLRREEMQVGVREVVTANVRRRTDLARLMPELGRDDPVPIAEGNHPRIFDAVIRVVETVVARRPTVLVLEDLHWADEMSSRLLVTLARHARSWPLLLVTSMRDEEMIDRPITHRLLSEIDREGGVTAVRLAPLAEADTLTLVTHLAPSSARDGVERLGRRVWQLSEGHPFMIVETVRAVRDGDLPETGAALPLAQRIQNAIVSRLERLSARSRQVVETAAVIGREFEYDVLQQACGLSMRAAAEAVQELARRRILQSVGDRLAFTHDRIREVASATLFPPRRRYVHGAVARAIEDAHAPDLAPHWGILAGHYRDAGAWAKMVKCLRRAAPVAVGRGAFRDAAAYLEEALASSDRLPRTRDTQRQVIDLRLELWAVLLSLGELERMFTCSREAEQMAVALGDRYRLGWTKACLSHTLWMTGDWTAASALAASAQAIGDRLHDRHLLANASLCLGATAMLSGEYRHAEVHLEKGAALGDGGRDGEIGTSAVYRPAVACRCWLTLLCAERGEFDRGLAQALEAVRLAESLDHPVSLTFAFWALGYLWAARGRLDEALGPLERSLAVAGESHLGIMRPFAGAWLGSAYAMSGRRSEGLALLQQSVDAYAPTMTGYSRALVHLGHAYLLAKRPEDAASSAKRADAAAREQGDRGNGAWADHLLGEIASLAGSANEAEDHYQRAMTTARELGMQPLIARCRLGLGRLYQRTGKLREAHEHLTTATTMYREMGMTYWLEKTEAEMKQLT